MRKQILTIVTVALTLLVVACVPESREASTPPPTATPAPPKAPAPEAARPGSPSAKPTIPAPSPPKTTKPAPSPPKTTKPPTTTTPPTTKPPAQQPAPPPAPGAPGMAAKPSTSNTGPTVPLSSTVSGDGLSGTHTGVRVAGTVRPSGPLTLKDCEVDGGFIQGSAGPVVLENCVIKGYFQGGKIGNTDPNTTMLTVRNSRITGPPSNDDAVRLGSSSNFFDNSKYTNALFENVIIEHRFQPKTGQEHYDLVQFAGGRNVHFDRVVFRMLNTGFSSQLTNSVNNGVNHRNVTMTDVWFDGGPFGYTVAGPMTIDRGVFHRSAYQYGWFYPGQPGENPVVRNSVDDRGNPVSN